jgi:hypothetical protein
MKTVKVRIAVAVDPSGDWSASGWLKRDGKVAEGEAMDIAIDGVNEGEARYWVEAELPIPEPQVFTGSVSDA